MTSSSLVCAVYYSMQLMASSQRAICSSAFRAWYTLCLLSLAAAVSFSRVYLGCHTTEQAAAGAALGALLGGAWSCLLASKMCRRAVESTAKSPLFQWLCVRDYSDIEYSPVEEYLAMKAYIASLPKAPSTKEEKR